MKLFHISEGGTSTEIRLQLLKLRLLSLRHGFNGSIEAVFHPAGYSVFTGCLLGEIPETDPLNPSGDSVLPTDHPGGFPLSINAPVIFFAGPLPLSSSRAV